MFGILWSHLIIICISLGFFRIILGSWYVSKTCGHGGICWICLAADAFLCAIQVDFKARGCLSNFNHTIKLKWLTFKNWSMQPL